jgi:hypothetical protein
VLPAGIVGVTFNTESMMLGNNAGLKQGFHQAFQVFWGKKCWRTTSQVYFPDHRRLTHQLPIDLPLFFNCLDIFFFNRMISRYLFITTAISTKRFAEWKMNINAYTICCIVSRKLRSKLPLPFFSINLIIPEWHRGVTGIPRYRLVVLFYQ